jgi:hypothetical protein
LLNYKSPEKDKRLWGEREKIGMAITSGELVRLLRHEWMERLMIRRAMWLFVGNEEFRRRISCHCVSGRYIK